ncbi:hypothetical protein GQF03_16295 [Sneathiella chungangensis]|uniref:Restriction endonuclease n=1 Tax=Sneathiella chungangensis TaxID=1418234 RepID=A0A845MIY1_9PROT|nr:hypothetical protein [Sneathiella chungangensis]MZR23898.1 hypothetical protein [Sneathiella chungangensis]
MNKPEFSVAQLRREVDGRPTAATIDYMLAQNHEARLAAVQKAVDFACNELEQHKHKKQGLGEDALTLELCSMLKMAGFQAVHDKDVGGHCDISIEGKDMFLWLAEAKKHSSYSWLDKGFQQLATRYSTGVKGQDHGDVLVYCYAADAKTKIQKWRGELESRNSDVKTEDSCSNPLQFFSKHIHPSSGLDFHVRHKAIALYWNPKDK